MTHLSSLPVSKRFSVISLLASGKEGDVVAAVDTQTQEEMAIKITELGDAQKEERFKVVCAKYVSLSHKYLCKGKEFFIEDGKGYLVMERLTGDLFDWLKKQNIKKLEESQAKRIFRKICKAVKFLHSSGIAHLDLKLENILMDSSGNPKLCDFGSAFLQTKRKRALAFLTSTSNTPSLISNLGLRGTQRYSSPELSNQLPCNPFSSDIYSLGVVLHILLTGHFPNCVDDESTLDLSHAKEVLSPLCFNLLLSALSEQQQSRATIDELLSHRWLKSNFTVKWLKRLSV